MLTQKKVIGLLKKELPKLASEYGVRKIAIFGSYAKGEQRKKSDIDILIDIKNLWALILSNLLTGLRKYWVQRLMWLHLIASNGVFITRDTSILLKI